MHEIKVICVSKCTYSFIDYFDDVDIVNERLIDCIHPFIRCSIMFGVWLCNVVRWVLLVVPIIFEYPLFAVVTSVVCDCVFVCGLRTM